MKQVLALLLFATLAACSTDSKEQQHIDDIEQLDHQREYKPDTVFLNAPMALSFQHLTIDNKTKVATIRYYLDVMEVYPTYRATCKHYNNAPIEYGIEFNNSGFDLLDGKGNISQYR